MLSDSTPYFAESFVSVDSVVDRLTELSDPSLDTVVRCLSKQLEQPPTLVGQAQLELLTQLVDQPKPLLTISFQVNKVADLTCFFQTVFRSLVPDGYLVFPVEFIRQRKARLRTKLPWGIAQVSYVGDYLLHRLAPRLRFTRSLYKQLFASTRVISKAEVLGRLYHAGFRVVHIARDGGSSIVIAQKVANEVSSNSASSEGLIFKMARVGKNGKRIYVYKLRTMHPYSEYLQEYLMQTSGLEAGGKFKDDFRISTLGQIARKYWIDELPMLINLLTGDLKLVGVRPISSHYFTLYPDELKQERVKVKPGLLPPYYADLPKNFDEIVASELRYLRSYQQSPLLTDIRYMHRIIVNIVLRSARSK